jgi:O-antigen ligase
MSAVLHANPLPAAGPPPPAARPSPSMTRRHEGAPLILGADLRASWLPLAGSALFWMAISAVRSHSNPLACAGVLVLAAIVLIRIGSRNLSGAMPLLAYLVAIEPAIREYAEPLRYLFVEYLALAAAAVALFTHRGRFRWPIVWLALYVVVELIDVWRAGNLQNTRSMVVLSTGRLALLVLAARAEWGTRGTAGLVRGFLIGTGTIAVLVAGAVLTRDVRWTAQANSAASADMGANQIGFLLAFGAFVAFGAAEFAETPRVRAALFGLVGLQAIGAMITFTRGAVVTLVLFVAFYAVTQIARQRSSAARMVVLLALLAGAGWVAVRLTDTMLLKRFAKEGVSNRDVIARSGWAIFIDNPLVGIGTGNFYSESARRGAIGEGVETGAHDEIVRAFAEHGIVGATIYFLFLTACWKRARRGVRGRPRLLCVLLFLFALVYEVHSGLKLAIQGLMFAMACEAFREPAREPAA